MSKTTPYILTDGEKYLVFNKEKDACDFLEMAKCSVASAYRKGAKCKGYTIIKGVSEWELYYDHRLWKIWQGMHERCELPSHKYYDNYGGRGIEVCEEWSDYVPFARWAMKNGYYHALTIDRINNDGDYEPANCRWASFKEQQNNKRNNHIVEYKGEKFTLTQLAEKVGIGKTTLRERLKSGMSVEDAVETPVRPRAKMERSE